MLVNQTMMSFFYLHGWASSPQSNKARFFRQRFAEQGIDLHLPDLNQEDFFHLTLTRQIHQVEALLPVDPVTMLGSSFGGLTALWLAQRQPQIKQLILLAPALNFATQSLALLTEEQRHQWFMQKELKVYHYGYEREMLLSYDFIEDLQNYTDVGLRRCLPTLIFHGRHDEVIAVQSSRDFAHNHPWVQLVELDSDHSLANVHELMWEKIAQFCFNKSSEIS